MNAESIVARETYRGRQIEIVDRGSFYKLRFRMRVDGELLQGTARAYATSTLELALEAARAHVRQRERTELAPLQVVTLEFQPESHVAHTQHGKYVIAVTYEGRPVGDGPATHAQTEFLPYFHPRTPSPGEPRCTFLNRGEGKCTTLEQALERCRTHAAEQIRASAPTAPGADA